jgi:antitoxin CptB
MPSEPLDSRRRRVIYRASHRGTKEMDWMLGRFAASAVAAMSEEALTAFESLVALPDPEVERMLLDPRAAPAGELAGLIAQMRVFHGLEGGN